MNRRLRFFSRATFSSRPSRGSALFLVLDALVALQVGALFAVAGLYFVQLARQDVQSTSGTVFAALSALVVAAGLLAAVRGLHRRRRWARAPVLVVQLLVALVAAGPDGLMQGGSPYVGAALCLYALIVIVLLFTPAVSHQLEE